MWYKVKTEIVQSIWYKSPSLEREFAETGEKYNIKLRELFLSLLLPGTRYLYFYDKNIHLS